MATNSPTFSDMPTDSDNESAADLIRQKLLRIYDQEPDAREELTESVQASRPSKHQHFMQQLSASGKDLATIQTEWHAYYQSLPNDEKHQVWQEFYSSQPRLAAPQTTHQAAPAQKLAEHKQEAARPNRSKPSTRRKTKKLRDARSKEQIQSAIRDKVSAGGKLQPKHHLQSLLFGLGMGFLVLAVFLFGFFNEVIIAPFIQPSRHAAATPIIVDSNSVPTSTTPEVIIPKINVEIPVVYGQTSINESVIEDALEDGVVHYPTTALPGQNGNAAFFGHSSNNIFNKGRYKFAFVLLHTLEPGDTFYLTRDQKTYVYKVTSKKVVDPSEVGVLDPIPGKTATATLITCDPPGTSLKRLIIVGDQISPDPAGNTASATPVASQQQTPTNLPGNGPTLFSRFIKSVAGRTTAIGVIVLALFAVVRWMNKPRLRLG